MPIISNENWKLYLWKSLVINIIFGKQIDTTFEFWDKNETGFRETENEAERCKKCI